mmetsp:Transcript_3211/g.8193  ORF Transcript_3211/g.8193 Transcript_3211/m.8193 type:complete len:495 (+) Transcript_3211:19-1503(+)
MQTMADADESPDSRSQRHKARSCQSKKSSANAPSRCRQGLRILIGTANLGNALPDAESISAWIPHHGKVHHVLNNVKSSSIVDGSKEDWNGIDTHGKIGVIVIGMQESVPGSHALTTTGLTAKLTGTTIKERNTFSKALGDFGKPIDELDKKINTMIATSVKNTHADLGGTKKIKEMLVNHIGEDYVLLNDYQRGEMVTYIFVRNDIAPISSVTEVRAENCGIGKVMANKGGISTMLTIGSTRLSFLSVHLEAGEGNSHYQERNKNMKEIIQGTNDHATSAHHAFVFGDLNYRFSLPLSPRGTEPPHEETMSVCQKIIAKKDWLKFNSFDELQRALSEKKVLVGFQTPLLRTFPTYKCERKKGYHYVHNRVPSHTDRILWKSNVDKETRREIEALIYEPVSKFSTSDHKPVRALFFIPKRPHLKLDHEKTTLHITITGMKCRGLKPADNILHNDIDTYLNFRCEPLLLEKKSSSIKNGLIQLRLLIGQRGLGER